MKVGDKVVCIQNHVTSYEKILIPIETEGEVVGDKIAGIHITWGGIVIKWENVKDYLWYQDDKIENYMKMKEGNK